MNWLQPEFNLCSRNCSMKNIDCTSTCDYNIKNLSSCNVSCEKISIDCDTKC